MANLIPRRPERDSAFEFLSRIRAGKVECAAADVASIRDLGGLTANGEALVGAAERALLNLVAYLRVRREVGP